MKFLEKFSHSNLFIYIIILIVMSSAHINLNTEFEFFRRVLFLIIVLLLLLHISIKKKINIPIHKELFILQFISTIVFSIFYLLRFDLYHFFGWLFTSITIILIWNLNSNQITLLFKKYLNFSCILIFFGIFILLLNNFDYNNFDYANPKRSSILKIFINSDSYVLNNIATGEKKYRFSFFLQQSSLVVTYILLPLIIYSLIKKPKFIILIICSTAIILSYSSTINITILLSLFIYFFYYYFKKYYKIIFLFFFIFSILIGLFFYLNFKMESNYSDYGLQLENYRIFRFSSGAYRLEIIGNQVYFFFTKYFFGFFDNDNINKFLLGNFYISSGIRGGITSLILAYVFFLKICEYIFLNTNLNKLASSFIIASIIFLTNFQDFGINSTSGFVFFALLSRLLFLENLKIMQKFKSKIN